MDELLIVDGVKVKAPSSLTWGLQDNSDSDAGRDNDDLMHKNRTSQKRKLNLSWNGPTPAETAAILQAFNPEYIEVTYNDAMSGEAETRTFYVGDRSAPVAIWTVNHKRYTSISFNIIER